MPFVRLRPPLRRSCPDPLGGMQSCPRLIGMSLVGRGFGISQLKTGRSSQGLQARTFLHPLLAGSFLPCRLSVTWPPPQVRDSLVKQRGRSPALRKTGTCPWDRDSGWLSPLNRRSFRGMRFRMTIDRVEIGRYLLHTESAKMPLTGSRSSQEMPRCSWFGPLVGTSLQGRRMLSIRLG
jgi:hypothetical protein